MQLPRLLTIMGSGETAPTMVKAHREVFTRLTNASARGANGILLDTPFGFQTNAPDIAARAASYFKESVGVTLEVAGLRRTEDITGPDGHSIVSRLSAAPFVFSGPGSPTYALRQWRGTLVPQLLAEKLALGGAVTFASAAALTLGVSTVPVYEIYKVGQDPQWEDGLDLLSPLGLDVVVIPHYDNAEGGNHDTRFCYLGEERLRLLEETLPDETFVLGVDEHTALMIDIDAASASVTGHGGVTIRKQGHSSRLEAGEHVKLLHLPEIADDLLKAGSSANRRRDDDRARGDQLTESAPNYQPANGPKASLFIQAARRYEEEFHRAKDVNDVRTMISTLFGLDDEIWSWSADTLQSDEMDRGRAALRVMVNELGVFADKGARDPSELVAPYVQLALEIRDNARRESRFADADTVRARLAELGVAVHDSAGGSTWELLQDF